jgi:hypothetical protein
VGIQPLAGSGAPASFERTLTVDAGAPGRSRAYERHPVAFDWTAEAGLYNVSVAVAPAEGGTVWDAQWRTYQAGYGPVLGTGWGMRDFPPAAAFDLDGEGATDLSLTDNKTGEPVPWSLVAYESTQGSSTAPYSRSLWIQVGQTGATGPVTDVATSEATVRALLGAGPAAPLLVDTQKGSNVVPQVREGLLRATVGLPHPGTPSRYVVFHVDGRPAATGVEPAPDHFRTRANVTHWDLDEDGQMDVRLWEAGRMTEAQARNQTVAQRQKTAVVLVAEARVEHRDTRRVVTFFLERVDGSHDGVWMEIQDAPRVCRTLAEAPGNATVRYEFSLEESFAETEGNVTWVWVGHFSQQQLKVILEEPAAPAATGEPQANPAEAPTGHEGQEVSRTQGSPGVGPLLAAALLGLAATRRR